MRVHCSYDKLIKIEDLKPNPRNPNTHPEEQIKLLAKKILKEGWRHPITVSDLSGLIVTGHARLEAAKLLELNEAPVDFQYYESTEAERRHMIADNRIQEMSEWDTPILKDELEDLNTGDFDIELTGFNEKDLEELMTQFNPDGNDERENEEKALECPQCGYEF